jgi:L-threonylcarbamoyladenylate synthase
LILHVDSAEAALRWIQLDSPHWLAEKWRLAASFWPGPLTVVVPRGKEVIDEVTAGASTVAIRVPSHPVMRSLLATCGFPIAAPSANPSNYVSPTCARHVEEGLGDKVAMILDGGECESGLESTIIRLVQEGVELLRPGGISSEQLRAKFGSVSISPSAPARDSVPSGGLAPMPAPGMLAKHYSPSKPLRRNDAWQSDEIEPARVARIVFAPLADAEAATFGWYRSISQNRNLNEVAHHLFTAIRDADASQCDWIVIDSCERTGIGRAIMDRIDRAQGP